LTANGDVVLSARWAHTRRKFYEVQEATGSPRAAEALRRISELYAIEAKIRGQSPGIGWRRAARAPGAGAGKVPYTEDRDSTAEADSKK